MNKIVKNKNIDFLIIGAMKCGTTSLHEYLNQHPEIEMSFPKEIHFFDDINYNENKIEEYNNYFKTSKRIKGTSPQGYTKQHLKEYQKVPKRIFHHLPDIKLIYILRNPIDRIYSHYYEQQYGGYYESKNLNEIFKQDLLNHFTKTSLYYYQIKNFLFYFPAKQIKIITLEELNKDPKSVLLGVFKFLKVKEVEMDKIDLSKQNVSATKKRTVNFKRWVPKEFVNSYKNIFTPKLRERINSAIFNKLIFKRDLKKEKLNDDFVEKLKPIFLKDCIEIERTFKIKLPFISDLKSKNH